MDFEKYCENLTDKLTDIMQHKAPTLLRNAELCVNPHYLDHERHHITFYGYFKIEDKNYQFFHLRVDIGSKEVCIQRLCFGYRTSRSDRRCNHTDPHQTHRQYDPLPYRRPWL